MSNVAKNLLNKLLAQVDRGGRETLPITRRAAKVYFEITSLSERDSVHASLTNAEVDGAISLEWGRGAAAQDLLRIRLCDADKLAKWLGIPRAHKHANRIDSVIAPMMSDAPEWLRSSYHQAMQNWNLGRSALRVRAVDTVTATNLLRIAIAVAENRQIGLDLRRFSVQLMNNSKTVENLLPKLAPLLRANPEWAQFSDNNELFRVLGLEKFPPPIYIKGPLAFQYSGIQWDITDLRPFVGISPDSITNLRTIHNVPYLLTIENLASFQRHVREVDDDGIVIYSAGFPSPALTQVLSWLDRCLQQKCLCFHWGDIDIGGIRIFSHVEKSLPHHRVLPHLMSKQHDNNRKFDDLAIRQLRVYSQQNTETGALARYWIENKLNPLEQEILDPNSPIIKI